VTEFETELRSMIKGIIIEQDAVTHFNESDGMDLSMLYHQQLRDAKIEELVAMVKDSIPLRTGLRDVPTRTADDTIKSLLLIIEEYLEPSDVNSNQRLAVDMARDRVVGAGQWQYHEQDHSTPMMRIWHILHAYYNAIDDGDGNYHLRDLLSDALLFANKFIVDFPFEFARAQAYYADEKKMFVLGVSEWDIDDFWRHIADIAVRQSDERSLHEEDC
jgi:hypothetical protein